jgi:hypothetical protein
MIAGVTTEIRTEDRPNMSLVRHRYASQFGFSDMTPYILVFFLTFRWNVLPLFSEKIFPVYHIVEMFI